uniref:ATP synthase F1 subunit epsilon n=1 Tax=Amphimedon queenslandica TaxID=400682 RepID=A0A1X7VKJ6_AMPQE
MTSYWRLAGMNYIQYSSLCARLLRRALKPEVQQQALKAEESGMKAVRWDKGKPTGETRVIGQAE